MIRLFTIFCKLNFNQISAFNIFDESMKDFSKDNLPFLKISCPCCGARNPTWSYHDSYPRYLISYENNAAITYNIEITRLACSSCNRTHAILPEIIVPYSSYSLTFILMVLKDYFFKMKIADICEKYQISVYLLYSWKHLFVTHKKLWKGILENVYQSFIEFLTSIPNLNTSNDLHEFFSETGTSFLQNYRKKAHFSSG